MIKHSSDVLLWPSGLRRWNQDPVRKGVGSNPTGGNFLLRSGFFWFSGATRPWVCMASNLCSVLTLSWYSRLAQRTRSCWVRMLGIKFLLWRWSDSHFTHTYMPLFVRGGRAAPTYVHAQHNPVQKPRSMVPCSCRVHQHCASGAAMLA